MPSPLDTPSGRAAVISALRSGTSPSEAASSIGTTVATLRKRAAEDSELRDALSMASAYADGRPHQQNDVPPATARRLPSRGSDDESAPAIDIELVTNEAREFADGAFGYLLWVDHKLADHGFPAMSDWWKYDLGIYYGSEKRWGVYEVGRGGGKSSTLTRVSATENVFAERRIPPGQRWIWPFISVATNDARRRIVEIQAILGAIGLAVTPSYPNGHPTIDMNDARGNPIGFVALASTIAGVSGPSTTGVVIDEEAKLRDRATNVNPSTEILASILQTFRARSGIRAIRCSSAWNEEGSHYSAIKEGDTIANHVGRIRAPFLEVARRGFADVAAWEEQRGDAKAGAIIRAHLATLTADSPSIPTWVANPTISAIASREEVEAMPEGALEGMPKVSYWLRENGSVPGRGGAHGPWCDQITGLVEANRALNRAEGAARSPYGLLTYPGLPAWDPRSDRSGSRGIGVAGRRQAW